MSNQKHQEQSDQSVDQQAPVQSHPRGPTSTEGVEANDLPNQGRGKTDPHHELDRNVPHHTGETRGSIINNDIGLTGHPDIREADDTDHGPRRHQGDK